jgi:hypothetical protein
MGALFSPEPDRYWSGRLRAFGEALGRFVSSDGTPAST